MTRLMHVLFYGARIAYLEMVHQKILQSAPHHYEVRVTWLELRRARAGFDGITRNWCAGRGPEKLPE
ncbi:MAG: hypothetical protein M9907_00380 [Burkholderiaceae bacterium]|nr:hypothetical protein [Burkholderiaceae bacterium]